jgi:tetratricopeptide (TPR) repeat protein
VAEQVTASAEAARHYYEGVDCLAHRRSGPSASGGCLHHFEEALADDPSFPLAHYQVALIRNVYGSPPEPAKAAVAAAMRGVDRLPRREALVVRALAARIDGKEEEAARLYDAALAEAPEDVEVLIAAADLEMGRSNWGAAVRYLEKVIALAPEQEDPLIDLVDGLGRLDRRKQLGELVKRIEADRTRPGGAKALVSAYAWMGEPARSVALARELAAGEGLGELEALMRALAGTGEYAESERVARRLQEKAEGDLTLVIPISQALVGQGRIRDALRELEKLRRASPGDLGTEGTNTPALHFVRSVFLAGAGELEAAAREGRLTGGLPVYQGFLVIGLLVAGDLAGGEALAATAPRDGIDAAEIAALLAWRRGDCESARAQLSAVDARDPWPIVGYAPSYLLAEVASACGDPREALTAVERFQRIPPRGPWRPWAFDRSLLLAARARLALGDRAGARRDVDRLLEILARADADLPLLREARQLRQRL